LKRKHHYLVSGCVHATHVTADQVAESGIVHGNVNDDRQRLTGRRDANQQSLPPPPKWRKLYPGGHQVPVNDPLAHSIPGRKRSHSRSAAICVHRVLPMLTRHCAFSWTVSVSINQENLRNDQYYVLLDTLEQHKRTSFDDPVS